jgi:hypothetical protein
MGIAGLAMGILLRVLLPKRAAQSSMD